MSLLQLQFGDVEHEGDRGNTQTAGPVTAVPAERVKQDLPDTVLAEQRQAHPVG